MEIYSEKINSWINISLKELYHIINPYSIEFPLNKISNLSFCNNLINININSGDFFEMKDKICLKLIYNKNKDDIEVEIDYNGNEYLIWRRVRLVSIIDTNNVIVKYNNIMKIVSMSNLRDIREGEKNNLYLSIISKDDIEDKINLKEINFIDIIKETKFSYLYMYEDNNLYFIGNKDEYKYILNLLLLKVIKYNKIINLNVLYDKELENYNNIQNILNTDNKIIYKFNIKFINSLKEYISRLKLGKNISYILNDDLNEFSVVLFKSGIEEYKNFLDIIKQDYINFNKSIYQLLCTDNFSKLEYLKMKSQTLNYFLTEDKIEFIGEEIHTKDFKKLVQIHINYLNKLNRMNIENESAKQKLDSLEFELKNKITN